MGALLSIPLLAVPSVSTVGYFPVAWIQQLLTPRVSISWSVSELPAAALRPVQQYAAHAGNARAGTFIVALNSVLFSDT